MRNYLVFVFLMILGSCGGPTQEMYNCGMKGQNCPTEENKRADREEAEAAKAAAGTSTHTSTDTANTVYVPIPGPAGKDGKDALQPFFSFVPATSAMCPTGGTVVMGGYDTNLNAVYEYSEITDSFIVCNGLNGAPGQNGGSCSVTPYTNGALISCEDGTTSVVLNGSNGTNGNNGSNGIDGAIGPKGDKGDQGNTGATGAAATPSSFSVVEMINPCGQNGTYDEILLRLGNGDLIAHYSDGNKQFLTILKSGNYVTTDFSPCTFTVNADKSVTW